MNKCSAEVWKDAWHTGQCSCQATIEREGKWYCAIHDPEYIKQKEARRKTKSEADNCKKCGSHFYYSYEAYCCICGTKRVKSKRSKGNEMSYQTRTQHINEVNALRIQNKLH